VLEGVHGVVVERRLVEKRQVPGVEADRPHGQRDERVRQDAQRVDDAEDRAQHRPRQPRDEAEGREVAEDHVLEHVREEELLLAEGVERRGEREDDEGDPEPEEAAAPAGHGRTAASERAGAARVEDAGEHGGRELERVERPAREQRGTHDLQSRNVA